MHLPPLEIFAILTVGSECLCFPHTSTQTHRPTQKPHDNEWGLAGWKLCNLTWTVVLRVWSVDQEFGITFLGVLEMPCLRPHPREADELEAAV